MVRRITRCGPIGLCCLALLVPTYAQGQPNEVTGRPRTDLEALTTRAEAGEAEAQFELGWTCHEGDGVPRDYDRAARWFPMAAFVLAQLHRTGEGVARDNVEAYAWLLVATSVQGVPPFIAGVRDEVAATLTADEIARAVRPAADRRPRGGAPATVKRPGVKMTPHLDR